MNSKYKFLCVILACVLILPVFSSCAGIGDGALFDNIQTSGDKNAEKLPENIKTDEMYVAGVGQYVETGREAVFKMYSPGGELQADLSFGYAVAKEFYDIIFYSERDLQKEIVNPDKNQTYIDLNLYFGSEDDLRLQGGFRIYANDYVEITEIGAAISVWSGVLDGYSEGIYQKVISCASESIKPDGGVLITIAPKPESHDLSVEDAAEIYKLLMTSDREEHDEPVIPTNSMETIQLFFTSEYGRAGFYVNNDDTVGYYEGFLEGEHDIYFKIEGIHKKLMDYIK